MENLPIILSENRPKHMTQLDWLWFNYKYFNVQNEPSEIPSDRIILTEQAITNLVRRATGGGITKLILEENPDAPEQMRLVGYAVNGEALTMVTMPKEEHIISFANRQVTQVDVDNNCGYVAGTEVLAITTNLGKTYMVSLGDLNLQLSGKETDTVLAEVNKGVITANVKIDENINSQSAVELKTTNKGIYSQLKIDDSATGVKLEITEKGLKASLPVTGSGVPIQFAQLTMDEYMALETPVENTIYFITDQPFIYLNGVRYGANILPGEYPIVSLLYDEECMSIFYKKADGSDIQKMELGPVSEEKNGMLTKDQWASIQGLLKAVGDISDIKKYVSEVVKTAAFSLEKGETENNQTPLILKDGVGNVLSTVMIDDENYLSFAEQRAATTEDIIAAAAKGMLVKEGEALLILTLTSGDKVYVSLSEVADIYTGESTNTIRLVVDKYKIKADVILPADEKILFESVNGLSARISIKQNQKTITLYGKTETEEDKLGEFKLNDQLLGYRVLRNYNEEMLNQLPPAQVDGADYDAVENPVYFGNTYLVLTMGIDTNDSSTSYRYHYYLNISGFLDEILLSSDEDNILSKGKDGHLYATVQWTDIN